MKILTRLLLILALPGAAFAHGLNGHVMVTDGALDFMADGELKELLSEPDVRDALDIGATFPDSGYAPTVQRYGEDPHWEPFVVEQIAYIQDHFAPPYDLETRRIIAFNLGSICHGMEDEIFDTLFDLVVREYGEEDLDTALDVFLVLDDAPRVIPPAWFPGQTMFEIYNDYYGVDVPLDEMERGMTTVYTATLEYFDVFAQGFEAENHYTEKLPWAHAHYMDLDTPSSFPHEMTIMGPFLEAVWKRIQGTFTQDDLIVGSVPVENKRLLSVNHESVDSWVTLYFGIGVWEPTLNAERVKLYDADQNPVSATIGYTRWSGGQGANRLVRIMADQDLAFDSAYEVVIGPGLEFIDGTVTDREYRFAFRTPCAPGNEEDCIDEPLPNDDDDVVADDDDDTVANDDDVVTNDDDTVADDDDGGGDDDDGGLFGCMSRPGSGPGAGADLALVLLLGGWLAFTLRRAGA